MIKECFENNDIYEQIGDFYHKKTIDKEAWNLNTGKNGETMFDEIQVLLQYLKNKGEKIENVDFFDKNLEYKKNEVDEPVD
ncbi:MAG: hypothetical protein Q8N69_02570, partial [bacterium]|nr:hypothetical protein [bacterium]